MSKHDLQATPVYHHIRESVEAHLSVAVAALAVSHWTEYQTGWGIKKFVRTATPSPKSAAELNTKLSQVGSQSTAARTHNACRRTVLVTLVWLAWR